MITVRPCFCLLVVVVVVDAIVLYSLRDLFSVDGSPF